ncbi:hypothetical protein AB0H83_14235 [Dactylosporangium sp. NPDC050688]|uniref:hypothetical protein n=1 Tax=Dactylosporangium sp. NPDC050688 TaxID=3157217 RepID=UPI0034044685
MRDGRYETWHLIDLYAYLGVGLVLPHQPWTGADFTASAPARVFWWSAYGSTLVAVLVLRVGMPVWRSVYHRLRVTAVVPEAPGAVSVHLRGHRLDRLPGEAHLEFGPHGTTTGIAASGFVVSEMTRATARSLGPDFVE